MSDRISKCLSIGDLKKHARSYLPRVIFDYLEGGADDEEALAENPSRIRSRKLKPRYMVDISSRSQAVSIFGQDFKAPVGISPMGMLGMVRHGGDLMLAEVAARQGLPFILSGASTTSIEATARTTPKAWLQYYPGKDREIENDLLKRATDAGMPVLVVTADVPLHAKRERNIRSGWVRPYKPTPAVILESLRHPVWVARYLQHGIPVMENFVKYAPPGTSPRDLTAFYASQVPTAHSWALIDRLRAQWKGKLVLKGVLSAEDALLAEQHGVDGLLVSNHGGRQLDRTVAAIDALPDVVAAVGDRLTVMFDSGIQRGSDIAIAMSLGAKMCFVGRSAAYGLAAGGTAGAARAIEILRHELDLTLGQIGCPDVKNLGPQYIHH
jgi:(S)-mandelate dehydrogenase